MICIIIPTYNEKENIYKLISRLNKLKLSIKIVIVDDSKKPLTQLKKLKNVKYIHRSKKLGRGSAVMTGIKSEINNKKNKIFLEMDADFSHSPNEIKRNLKYFNKQKLNFLIASRYLQKSKIMNWPLSRHLLSKISNILARILLGVPIKDYTNGFRFYDRAAAKYILRKCNPSKTSGFIILSEIALELYKKNFRIGEIQTIFVNRTRGESKANLSEIFSAFFGILMIFIKKRVFK